MNKDDYNTAIFQSCLARSEPMEDSEMVFKELNNSLIFYIFSPAALNISNSIQKWFSLISPSPSHFLFSTWLIAASRFYDSCSLLARRV